MLRSRAYLNARSNLIPYDDAYVPPLSNEIDVKEKIMEIIEEEADVIDIAIKLCLYCVKKQIFIDGK